MPLHVGYHAHADVQLAQLRTLPAAAAAAAAAAACARLLLGDGGGARRFLLGRLLDGGLLGGGGGGLLGERLGGLHLCHAWCTGSAVHRTVWEVHSVGVGHVRGLVCTFSKRMAPGVTGVSGARLASEGRSPGRPREGASGVSRAS